MQVPDRSSPLKYTPVKRLEVPKVARPKVENSEFSTSNQDGVDIDPANLLQTEPSSSESRPRVVEGEVMIKTKSSLFKSEEDGLLDSLGATVKERFEFPDEIFQSFDGEVLRLQLPTGLTTKEALQKLARDPRVEYAVPNEILYLDEVTEDSLSSPQENTTADDGALSQSPEDLDSKLWGLHNTGQDKGKADADIDAPEAWKKTQGSKDVLLAVIDTGVDYNHPDLEPNMWTNPGEVPGDGIDNDGNGVIDDVHGYNAFDDNGDPMDGHSHGTHAAGSAAAKGGDGQGVTGVAGDTEIMAVKIFSDTGKTTSDSILRGVLYAVNNGADITSNSWGGGEANALIKEAFEKSTAFHVMAAGNKGRSVEETENFPSGYEMPNSISVAATNRNDELWASSNFGVTEVDIAAPGAQIYSTMPNGEFGFKSGTSMATPHVAGAAALLLAENPSMTNEELKAQLMNGADKLTSLNGKVASGGRLNVNNSLEKDKVAPSEIRDLAGEALRVDSIGVSFLATGDDGLEGKASSYQLRISEEPIQTLEQFLAASAYEVPKPAEAGTQEAWSIPVAPSTEERTMHVAVRAFDNLSNASPFSNIQIEMPKADLAYSESIEDTTTGWTTEGSWGLETVSGKTVFSDSPRELSKSKANDSITSPPIDLSEFKNSSLMFDTVFKLEEVFDQIHLEAAKVPVDGEEQAWVKLKSYTGSGSQKDEVVDLSAFDGEKLQFRFRLTTDQSYTEDGFHFDKVRILGEKTTSS